MQFFRGNFHASTDLSPRSSSFNQSIYQNFSNWGFVRINGQSILPRGSNDYPNLRWKYDSDASRYIRLNTTSYVYYDYFSFFNLPDISKTIIMTESSAADQNIIFFPLRNRGFYFLNYKAGPQTANIYSNDYPAPVVSPCISDETFENHFPSALFCFFNNCTNTFNYCYIQGKYSKSSNFSLIKGPYQSLNMLIDSDNSKTDSRQNLCTLIKYPTSEGFLSNLFLLSTVPGNLSGQSQVCGYMQNQFFSFGGRSFYCPGCNLVVELPSN